MAGSLWRGTSDVLKRGYSDEEVEAIYELGRFFLEQGELRRAEILFQGLVEVAPEFVPAALGLSYVFIMNKEFENALTIAKQALRAQPHSPEGLLFMITCLLSLGDYTAAGTHLGELQEQIDARTLEDPQAIRFYKLQLARYQSREK